MASEMMIYELAQLQRCADRFGDTVSALETIDSCLKNLMGNSSNRCWQGKAVKEFEKKIGETYQKFSEILEQYHQEHTKLAEAIAVYREKEGIISNDVSKLATGDIF